MNTDLLSSYSCTADMRLLCGHRYQGEGVIRLLGRQIQGLDSRLDNEPYRCHYKFVKQSKQKPPTSIRINRDILHQAHVAAVTERKTLGQWLEEAIIEEDCKRKKESQEVRK